MNGRFSRLEFRDEEPRRETAEDALAAGTPVRDAAHFMAQADEAARLGRFESALQLYTRALREDRARLPAWVGQVQMLVELRELSEARLWADKALELFKGNGELLAAKAQACARSGDLAGALASSDGAIKAPGSSAWRWEARGEVLLARREARHRECFEKAFAEPGADWHDRLVAARAYLYYSQTAAALEFAQAAVELKPAHPYCWFVLARCQDDLGWGDTAATTLERCLQLQPRLEQAAGLLRDVRERSALASVSRRLGRLFRR